VEHQGIHVAWLDVCSKILCCVQWSKLVLNLNLTTSNPFAGVRSWVQTPHLNWTLVRFLVQKILGKTGQNWTLAALRYAPLHYITPLFTSPVWVLSMDMSHSFYYKYKHRIYCGGRRNKEIPTRILLLCLPPPPSLLTFWKCLLIK
jgi:hypothetical protein